MNFCNRRLVRWREVFGSRSGFILYFGNLEVRNVFCFLFVYS